METYPSICIPRATIIESNEVKAILEKLFGTATIDRVDIVPCKDIPEYCKIFIHMKYWPENNNIKELRTKLINGNCINIVVRGNAPHQGLAPYFWKCFMSRLPKPKLK